MNIENYIHDWHTATFPNATEKAIIDKLKEECLELLDAIDKGDSTEIMREAADVLIVASSLGTRTKSGILSEHVAIKMAINESRQWGKENSEGDRPRERLKHGQLTNVHKR